MRYVLVFYTVVISSLFLSYHLAGQEDPDQAKWTNDKGMLQYMLNYYKSKQPDTTGATKAFEYRSQLKRKMVNLVFPVIKKEKPKVTPVLYEREKQKLLTVVNVYLCGKCLNKHVGPACAFPVTEDGICVTNYHVFNLPDEEAKRSCMLAVMDYTGKFYPIREILSGDKANDIAVFKIETNGKKFRPYRMAETDPEVGSDIILIAHPDKHFYRLSQGIVTGFSFDPKTKCFRTEVSTVFAPGSSGAPILSNCGEVIGMVSTTRNIEKEGRFQMMIYEAVPISKIRKLLYSGNIAN